MTPGAPIAIWAVAILMLAACGGGSGVEDLLSEGETQSPTTTGDDSGEGAVEPDAADEDGPGFGDVLEATVTLSGASDESYTVDDETAFAAAGGCIGDGFGLQLQALDTTVEALGGGSGVTALVLRTSVGEDLAGGGTGVFDEEIEIEVFEEPGELTTSQRFSGPGVVDISVHQAPNDLAERRMRLVITGERLEGNGDAQLDVEADVLWIMGCP